MPLDPLQETTFGNRSPHLKHLSLKSCICARTACILLNKQRELFPQALMSKYKLLLLYQSSYVRQPSKMSGLGSHFQRMSLTRAYTILSHSFALLVYGNCRVNFRKKNLVLPVEKFVSYTIQECDNVTTPYYPISALLSFKWSLTES